MLHFSDMMNLFPPAQNYHIDLSKPIYNFWWFFSSHQKHLSVYLSFSHRFHSLINYFRLKTQKETSFQIITAYRYIFGPEILQLLIYQKKKKPVRPMTNLFKQRCVTKIRFQFLISFSLQITYKGFFVWIIFFNFRLCLIECFIYNFHFIAIVFLKN